MGGDNDWRIWIRAKYEPSRGSAAISLRGGAAELDPPGTGTGTGAGTGAAGVGRTYEIVGSSLRSTSSTLSPQRALKVLLERASIHDLAQLRRISEAGTTLRASRETRRLVERCDDVELCDSFLRIYESQPRTLFTGGSFPVLLRVVGSDGASEQVREYAVNLEPVRRPTRAQVRDLRVRACRIRFHRRLS